MNGTKRLPTLSQARVITVGVVLFFLILLIATSPSLAKPTPLTSPAQTATGTTTINSTLTSTSSTYTTSTTSSTTLTTLTSVTTLSSTVFTYSTGFGYGQIPGFPVEAILLGFAVGVIALAILRRRDRSTL
ncbi:MAG TPA: Loki-CTERM sorting domain-containing protein [Methylomirabilota bacterium]|nr:Loki-CTERM sorting domain-containing protein [Methylomirabilota bacterium]